VNLKSTLSSSKGIQLKKNNNNNNNNFLVDYLFKEGKLNSSKNIAGESQGVMMMF